MEIALEKLTKTDLIALIGQKDVLLKERDVTIQQKESRIAQKEIEIAEKETEIAEKAAEIAEKKAEIREKQIEIMVNKAEIEKLRRMLFGQKRERFETSPIQPLRRSDSTGLRRAPFRAGNQGAGRGH